MFAGGASQVGRVLSLFGGRFRSLVAANLSLAAGFGVTISVYRSYLTEVIPEFLRQESSVSVPQAAAWRQRSRRSAGRD